MSKTNEMIITEMLINEVSQRPILYNHHLPLKMRTPVQRAQAWQEVCANLSGKKYKSSYLILNVNIYVLFLFIFCRKFYCGISRSKMEKLERYIRQNNYE